jgi:hypothetical protein
MKKKKYPAVDAVIDKLFEDMIALAPRRPTPPSHGRLRKRWRRPGPVPASTEKFAKVRVYVFAVGLGHIVCQAAQTKMPMHLVVRLRSLPLLPTPATRNTD